MKNYYITILPTIFITLRIVQYVSAKSLLSGRKDRLQKQPGLFHRQPAEPFGLAIPRKSNSTLGQESSANTTNITTDIAELIDCFQNALIIANQDEHEIHVGKLLLACDRLESTMRRIGFTQSAKDIAGNIRKIRRTYSKLPESHRDCMPAILEHEIESGINMKKIPENSAACGFLWLGRSLNYQYAMFCHMLDNDDATPYEAASVSYERDLKPYLPWPLQKICQAAMCTLKAKRRKQIFADIGGFSEECYGEREEEATKKDLRQMMDFIKSMLCRWRQVCSDLELGTI
mmetsp:Transcript_14474/g.21333  ORF Transcript_14474/g.21333 Transcript_14474/m.21333 type:complete len:289 (+) Transcript_14474:119-985(+)